MLTGLEQAGFTRLCAVLGQRWGDGEVRADRFRGRETFSGPEFDIDVYPFALWEGKRAVEFAMREWGLLPRLNAIPGLQTLHRVGALSDGSSFVAAPRPTVRLSERTATDDPVEDALELGIRLADALSSAHSLGLAHGAVNADSVLLRAADAPLREAVLSGFGRPRFHTLRALPDDQDTAGNQDLASTGSLTVVASMPRGPAGDSADLIELLHALAPAEALGRRLDPFRGGQTEDLAAVLRTLLAETRGGSAPVRAPDGPRPPESPRRHSLFRLRGRGGRTGTAPASPDASGIGASRSSDALVPWPWEPRRSRLRVPTPAGWHVTEKITATSPLRTARIEFLAVGLDPHLIDDQLDAPPDHGLRLIDGTIAVRHVRENADGRRSETSARPRRDLFLGAHAAVADPGETALIGYLDRLTLEVATDAPTGRALSGGSLAAPIPQGWRLTPQLVLNDPAGLIEIRARIVEFADRMPDAEAAECRITGRPPADVPSLQHTATGLAVSDFAERFSPVHDGMVTTITLTSLLGPCRALEVVGDWFDVNTYPDDAFYDLLGSFCTAEATLLAQHPDAAAAAAEFLDAYLASSPDLRTDALRLPTAMRSGPVDVHEAEVRWRPIPSTVTEEQLHAVEEELDVHLPASYKALLLDRHFGPLELWDVDLPAHLPGIWPTMLHEHADELRRGLLPIATIDLEEWDNGAGYTYGELMYRWDPSSPAPEDAEVRIWTGEEMYPAFSSGAAMFRCLAKLATLSRRPSFDADALAVFLSGDPEPAPFWTALARGERPMTVAEREFVLLDEQIREALRQALRMFGPTLREHPGRLRAALSDTLDSRAAPAVDALVVACETGVAAELGAPLPLTAPFDPPVAASQVRHWSGRLVAAGLSEANATWAMSAWAEAIGFPDRARAIRDIATGS